MLKNISPCISPNLLKILMEMGHGDEIVIADGNFPAESHAKKCIRADGLKIPELLQGILDLMPLDSYVDKPVTFMMPDQGIGRPKIWGIYEEIINKEYMSNTPLLLERFKFYEKAKNAYAILATSEDQLYANIILRKGVISLE
ncbi:RbsD/FucU domain-containing protein [Solibacillus sp. FSL W7-1464]|uniref:RbsD/FucU family protein n=1 Tax=Solibacillus sp. FSL W7-1464 TaxID=2921706 RepID=UPI0030F98B47